MTLSGCPNDGDAARKSADGGGGTPGLFLVVLVLIIFACGDACAVTVPKLGILAHIGEEVAQHISQDPGFIRMSSDVERMDPIVDCIGDTGNNQAFYISSNTQRESGNFPQWAYPIPVETLI